MFILCGKCGDREQRCRQGGCLQLVPEQLAWRGEPRPNNRTFMWRCHGVVWGGGVAALRMQIAARISNPKNEPCWLQKLCHLRPMENIIGAYMFELCC